VSGRLRVALAGGPLERLAVDVAVVGVPSDERPLQGCAGRADWRLCGRLSALLEQGRLRGDLGEAALLPSTGGIRAPLVLALGHGQRVGLDAARCRAIARDAVARALDLRAATLALPVVELVQLPAENRGKQPLALASPAGGGGTAERTGKEHPELELPPLGRRSAAPTRSARGVCRAFQGPAGHRAVGRAPSNHPRGPRRPDGCLFRTPRPRPRDPAQIRVARPIRDISCGPSPLPIHATGSAFWKRRSQRGGSADN